MGIAAPRRRALSFHRRLTLSLIVVALVPLVGFGLFVTSRVESTLASAADDRVRDALTAIDAVLARRQQALTETATAYATWPVTADLIARGDVGSLRDDILAFVEDRGAADVAIAVIGGETLATGDPSETAALAALAADQPGTRPTIVPTSDGLLQVSVAPIGPTGADPSGDRLVFADRLDSEFALEVRGLTGFDVAILADDGRITVASDPEAATATSPDVTGDDGVSRTGPFVAGWTRPSGADGAVLLITTREDAVYALLAPLPAVLLATLGIAALLAILVSVLVGRDLNVRLSSIHRGLLEVAAGRRPATGAPGGPDVERLADALDGLVVAMDRRERILREASMTVAGWHPEIGEAATATAAAEGGVHIFGARACWIVAADGSRLAGAPSAGGEPDGRRLEAPLETGGGPTGWLHAEVAADPPWTEADDALFGMYALLVGGALDDARVHEVTSERVERLGRLNDLQREFLRSVSHNLQTPLTTITLVADDLADPTVAITRDEQARRVRAIQIQARRLERLVSQLITVSRMDAGRLELERDAVTIAPIVRRVWSALDTDRTLDVADGAGDVVPLGDRQAIEQILWILLDNAVRYAPTGPIRVATSAEPAADGPRVRIEVQDRGPGVPEADRRRIFQRFWSGSSDGTHGGTGIGLDIARRLARAMAGSLRYEAGRTPGATFVLTLPADVARPD